MHIKCNDLNHLDYNLLKSKNEFWYCVLCTSEILPFCSSAISGMSQSKGNLNKPNVALSYLMNQLNNFTDDEKENKLKWPNCKYREIDYFQKVSKNFKRKTLSLFFMNVCSLVKNLCDFNKLLNDLNVNFLSL